MDLNQEPLTAWEYFWLEILYAVPVIGFIFLIIDALGSHNINRRNFAKSHFCIVIIILIMLLFSFIFGFF